MAYYQDTQAPYVGPTRDAWADQYKNLQLLLPILAQEDEQRKADAAARSVMTRNMVDALREPVKQELQPTYGSIAPQISGDLRTIGPDVGLRVPPTGGVMPPPAVAPQRPAALSPLAQAMQSAMREPGVDPNVHTIDISGAHWVPGPQAPEPQLMRPGYLPGSGQPFSPVTHAPPQAYPQNAAELAMFEKLAPYLTQRRSTEEAYRRGIGEAVIRGNYGRDRTAANDATKLAQSMLMLKRPPRMSGSVDAYWRKYVPLMQNTAQQYLGAQAALDRMESQGYARADATSQQRALYQQTLNEVNQRAADLMAQQQNYATIIGAPNVRADAKAQSTAPEPQSEELDFKPLR